MDLYNLFKEKYPSVHHALIIKDKYSNISKGYGFIIFLKKEEATKCIEEMNGYILYNKSLILKEKNNKTRDNNKKSNNKNKTEINSEDEEKENDEEEEREIEEENEKEEEKENEKEEKVITSSDFEIKFIGNLKGHKGPITSLVCSVAEKNEKYVPLLFSGSEDNTIIKWKLFFKNGEFEVNEDSEENK